MKERPAPQSPVWEALCERCGRCCFEKIEYEGEVYYTDRPCPHLDPETRLCRVYDQRHRIHPECVPLDETILDMGVLPGDCPYVRGRTGVKHPRLWDED
ncbi:hypothetical protein EDC39_101266 [Geothermobacter ehrlichii]|uniref:YcgN family cysteine cluster protein n=1 Tax=Geothermobacter ehrlichii TaxID=213224 RepID=A0A5D3WLS2_9BACT|nr:hypothetical protein [Geothermobacter ehrlichii]TYP00106.1 hypothetical protein EDC39_101266 [Geothermobacter ehrlichii]